MSLAPNNSGPRPPLPRELKPKPEPKPLDPYQGLRDPYDPRPDACPQPQRRGALQ